MTSLKPFLSILFQTNMVMKLILDTWSSICNKGVLVFFVLLSFVSCEIKDEKMEMLPPDPNRFTTSVLTKPGTLNEPMAFTFLSNEEILIVERTGGVKAFNVPKQEMRKVGHVPVNVIYTNKEGQTRAAEEGLIGVVAHPRYQENHWVFLLYADPNEPKHVLARWEFKNDSLYEDTKKIVLEYPVQREVCCHTGGGMVFDKAGNLYITTGNNTANPPRGTSNLDERPGFENADDQRTSGNTNDLRGKILRIHPEDDGSYTIPEGNLFPKGIDKTRPEIYTMGHRNPWRISIDNKTGYIYWGEVGPDASEDTEYGPKGYDEFNQAKGPGFFGWPYFIGNNQPYMDYDFAKDSVGAAFDVNKVVNHSLNNTGLTELPKPVPAFLWYPYSYSEEFPLMGSAGRSATGGPIFRETDFPKSDQRFPKYFEGKWLVVEFMRGWIMAVTMDENGDYVSMEPFLPQENFSSAIDMQFSPTGDLYVLEYGSAWFRGNENAQIKQIRYNGGNRAPVVQANADKLAGAVPFTVNLSAEGTVDYDNDALKYTWTITAPNGYAKTLKEANPTLTLEQAGIYQVDLTVTDKVGKSSNKQLELVVGNEPPAVDIVLANGNQSFFFPSTELQYKITVMDKEDGSIEAGQISAEAVSVNFDYAPEGFDLIEIAQNHKSSDDWIVLSKGKTLIGKSDCLSCHREDVKSIGPSYLAVAQKYKDDPQAKVFLAERIIKGSVGRWGEHAMSAHPDLSTEDAQKMVDYILSLSTKTSEKVILPLQGTFTTNVPPTENGKGGYLLRVAYTDKGNNGLKALSSEKIIVLRNPILSAEHNDDTKGTQLLTTPSRSFNVVEHLAYVGYKGLDLTGIKEIEINAEASSRSSASGGVIEVYLDSPDGQLIGTTEMIIPIEIDFQAAMAQLIAAWEKGGKKGTRPGFREVRAMFKKTYNVSIQGVQGIHDIYFVIKNTDAKQGQILLSLEDFTFKNGSTSKEVLK